MKTANVQKKHVDLEIKKVFVCPVMNIP